MTKENLNTTENKKTQEEKVMKKFVDEEYYIKHHIYDGEKSMAGLYEVREMIVNDIPEIFKNMTDEDIKEKYNGNYWDMAFADSWFMFRDVYKNIVEFIKNEVSALIFVSILAYSGLSEEAFKTLDATYADQLKDLKNDSYDRYAKKILRICDSFMCNILSRYIVGTYSVNGDYKKIKIKYADYKSRIHFPYTYMFKTGEYNPEDKTIEIYVRPDLENDCIRFGYIPEYEEIEWWEHRDVLNEVIDKMVEFNKQNEETTKENEIQGEKVMKKEIIIGMVENTYEIVGKSRTINNCTGIDNIGLRDAAIYIFGNNEEEENENKKLLVDYYRNQSEEFFDSYEISGEELVGRMAKDLIKAKTNAPEFDEWDLWKMDEQIMAEAEVFRAEFLNTYRKLDTKDNELEKYLTNFLTSYRVWFDLSKDTDGSFYLIKKIYENDTKFGGDPYTGIVYEMKNWAEYVEEVAAWLNDIMNIAIEFGTYSTNGKYKTVDYENYISLKTDININIYEMECVAKNTINKIWDLRYRNRDEISLLRLMVKEIYVEDEEERDEDEPDAKYGKIVGFYIADKEKK